MTGGPGSREQGVVGRRRGTSTTRDEILDSAHRLFAERGFDAASIRAIASDAGVDPALIRHHFGTKAALVAAVVESRIEFPAKISRAISGDPRGVGWTVSNVYLGLWDDPRTGPTLIALARSAATSPEATEMLRKTLGARIAEILPSDPERRTAFALAGAQLFGVAFIRHVLALGPVAALSHEELVDLVAPGVQALVAPEASSP